MSVSLTPEIEALILKRVESGQYPTAGDVVRDALRLVEASERRHAELRAAIAVAEDQVERGQVCEWTPDLHAEIFRRAREAAKAGEQPKADVCP